MATYYQMEDVAVDDGELIDFPVPLAVNEFLDRNDLVCQKPYTKLEEINVL